MPVVPADLLTTLRPLAVDGVLPPWSEWFGPGVMDALVPDAATRATIVAELPRLPIRYFDDAVEVPAAWSDDLAAGYVLLSAPYAPDAAAARARAWPVREHPSSHLAIVTDAAAVTDAIVHAVAAPPGR
jgi:hypothetical protein